jgi:hypothetical protein
VTDVTLRPTRRTKRAALAVSLAVAAAAASIASGILAAHVAGGATAGSRGGSTVTYTAIVKIPAPPASNFPGASAGGDGWAVALSATQVFNVFHHKGFLGVNCHEQSDASLCWPGFAYKTITEGDGGSCPAATPCRFATSGQPGLWFDQKNGHLYVFATRLPASDTGQTPSSSVTTSAEGGVVCIDTTQPASVADPFCGFTVLGNAPAVPYPQEYPHISAISDPVILGTNWYAFDYFFGATPAGAEDKMLCFSLAALSACPGQPFAVNYGRGTVVNYNGLSYSPTQPFSGCGTYPCPVPSPSIAAIGNQVVIPLTTSTATGHVDKMACFDPATAAACAGSWPVQIASGYPGAAGAPFPLLSPAGVVAGVCLPFGGTDPCYGIDGQATTTPKGLPAAVSQTSQWDGPALTVGARVYVPNWWNVVYCFDYSTGASCPNFPKSFANLGGLYTVNADPQRPACIWVNADQDSFQIQNFDAFTGAACGQGATRVLASTLVVPQKLCTPFRYTSLQVLSPQRRAYTSGSVQFENPDGVPLAGTPTQALDSQGSVNLSPLNLTTKAPLPQFLITFKPPITSTSVTVKLTWSALFSTTCLQPGTTAHGPTTTFTMVRDAGSGGAWTGKELDGASAFDTATITGRSGLAPTGTVTYSLFRDGTCSGAPVRTEHVRVTSTGAVPQSSASSPLSAGSYSFRATFSGDGNYLASAGACERFAVSEPGYRLVGGDGGVFAFHQTFKGSLPPPSPPGRGIIISNAVGIVGRQGGYWVADAHGEVYAFGNASFHGSCPQAGSPCHGLDDIAGIAVTPDGGGYWLVGGDGSVYAFGDATGHGSLAGKGIDDIVAIANPDARGYWLVSSTGNVYPFGDARSAGNCLHAGSGCQGISDVVGIASTTAGGYWLASRDGGVFAFGADHFHGSCLAAGSGCRGIDDVVGIAAPDAGGYWLAESDGGVLTFGDAKFFGSCDASQSGCVKLARPIVGIS